jgi:hypothetical protein
MKLAPKVTLLLLSLCVLCVSLPAPSFAGEEKKEEKKEGEKKEGKKEEKKEGEKKEGKKEEKKEGEKKEGKKEEKKEGEKKEGEKKEEKKEGEKKEGGKKEEKKEEKKAPQRTFEGIEPLFYLDSKRHPYIDPFFEKGEEKYYICRGTVGDWYRDLLTRDMNALADKVGVSKVTGKTCAMRLVPTEKPPKLPIVTIEFYTNTDVMRTCVLGEFCPQPRFVIFSVKDRTLYRTYILSDHEKHIYKEFCLNNKSEILDEESCWKHFEDE